MIKLFTLAILLIGLTTTAVAQQRPPFSEKTEVLNNRTFMPYTKGEVECKTSGVFKPEIDKIWAIIAAWDSIAPPQGLRVGCYGDDNFLEVVFCPYLFEENYRFAAESGSMLNMFFNDPLKIVGSPVAPGIFLCPRKTADFYSYPIYSNDQREVTVVCKKKLPLFLPVSQEEYLKALITKVGTDLSGNSGSDFQTTLREMEQAYQKLLKMDKEAAKDFKRELDNFKAEVNNSEAGTAVIDPVAMLKKELSGLTAEQRTRQAYYAGASAMEEYHNVSGLVPYENRENADALVRLNPALIDASAKDKIQLIVSCWSVGKSTVDSDKPRLYNEGRKGFSLADNLMKKLYDQKEIWDAIFAICK